LIALAKQLRCPDPDRRPVSLRQIAEALAERGHLSKAGKPYTAQAIANMLAE
jgi:hypothetical protein